MSENKNEVSERHKREWEMFRKSFLSRAMEEGDGECAKLAKAVADVLKVYQEGERKAYGFTEEETGEALEIRWLQ